VSRSHANTKSNVLTKQIRSRIRRIVEHRIATRERY
jgi:hypothetical protein